MYINKKTTPPCRQADKEFSMYVFIYYTNNRRFCMGYYDFTSDLWIDSDGMVITEDFLWCYLPVKQMKAYINSMRVTEEKLY
jgi:hypothetical protein